MKTELRRIAVVCVLALIWIFAILLNFNGYLIQITKFAFYITCVLYLWFIVPDVRYMFKRDPKSDTYLDKVQRFKQNVYRYFFFYFSFLILFHLSLNLFFIFNSSVRKAFLRCSVEQAMSFDEIGLVNFGGLKISNGKVSELHFTVFVKENGNYNRINVDQIEEEISCSRVK